MAIGKPLLVQERKGVAKPVLSAQTQQLSTNVAAQKMEMADYNIGMNNAMASQQVTGELVSMVNAGINAKVYAEQTKQQYNRLNLMEDWNKTDNEFKTRFAKAITPEEQEVVINDFSVSMEKRTADYRKGGGTGLPTGDSIQSQRDLSSLRNRSNNLYSKFATTMNANINTRTNAMLDTNTKALMKQVTTDENADPISIMNQIKENYAKKVQTGGLLKEQAEWNLGVNTDTMVTGRAILFAKSLAKETIGSTSKRPLAPAELKTHMEKVLGMPLTKRRHKLLTDAYKETYYKELTTFNAEEGAQDKYGNQKSKELVSTFEAEWYTVYSDKIITASERQGLIEKAKVIDYWRPGFSDLKIAELDASEFGAANTTAVTSMTVGEESDEIKAILDPDKTGYYSDAHLSALGTSLTAKGHTLKTIDGVLNVYRGKNAQTEKNVIATAPVALSDVIAKNITDKTPVGEAMMADKTVFNYAQAKDVNTIGWDKAVQKGRWGTAYNKTLAQLQVLSDQHHGWASIENQKLPIGERIALFKKQAQDIFQNNLNAELEKFNALEAKKLADKERAARLKTGGLTKVRGAGEVGKDTGIPQTIKPPVISSPETLDMTILNSNLLSGDYAKVISEGLPTAIREYFKRQNIKLGYTGDLNNRKKGIQDLAIMSENIENSYLGIFAKGVSEIASGAVGQMKEDAEAVMNYAMEGLANFTAQKLNAGQKPPTGDTSYNIYTGEGEEPEGEGEEGEPQVAGGGIGTGKGLWSPTELPKYNTFQDFLKDAEGLKDGGVEYTDLGTDQTNIGYGVNVKGKGVEQLIQKMQQEGKSQEEINEATLGLAISNARDKANRQYSKSLKKGQVAFDDQPIIIQELLTELAYNSKESLSSKQGWPKLMKAAKNRDYDTVLKEMYLNEEKQGATRRNELRKTYFETRIGELQANQAMEQALKEDDGSDWQKKEKAVEQAFKVLSDREQQKKKLKQRQGMSDGFRPNAPDAFGGYPWYGDPRLEKPALHPPTFDYPQNYSIGKVPRNETLQDALSDAPPWTLAKLGELVSPSRAEASAGQMGLIVPDTYTVQSGDTLSQIAKDNDLKMKEIKALNPQIKNINLIKVGQEINLGSMSPEPPFQRGIEDSDAGGTELWTRLKQQFEGTGASSGLVDTAPKAYLKGMSGDTGIWREDLYTKPEQDFLRKVAVKKIKQGKLTNGELRISYRDWTPEGGSKIGYKMGMPDTSRVDNNLQYTLGQAQIVRKGDKILVADEWDIQSPEKIHDMPLWDRVGTIYEKMKKGDASLYGLAHLLGEAFGPQAGEGASIRALVGTSKSLKLSKAQMKKIPTLEEYEAKNAGRINPQNLGKVKV